MRYGGSFDLGVSICDDAMQGFPLQASNAVLAAALDSNEALQTLLNVERSSNLRRVSVSRPVVPEAGLGLDCRLQAGWMAGGNAGAALGEDGHRILRVELVAFSIPKGCGLEENR